MGAADGVAAVQDKCDWLFQLQKQLGHSSAFYSLVKLF